MSKLMTALSKDRFEEKVVAFLLKEGFVLDSNNEYFEFEKEVGYVRLAKLWIGVYETSIKCEVEDPYPHDASLSERYDYHDYMTFLETYDELVNTLKKHLIKNHFIR